jgi:pullulanase-type alpha-1,6-glucosidase
LLLIILEEWSMTLGFKRLVIVAMAASPTWVFASVSACDGPDFQTVLKPAVMSSTPPPEARAYWLSQRVLQWPRAQKDADEAVPSRFKLYYSANAALQFAPGMPISGADAALSLDASDAGDTNVVGFDFIEAGPLLRVREADLSRLPPMLRAQALLVHEAANGEALAATSLQIPGALDDRFGAAAEAVSDLGAYSKATVTGFKLWAPTAQRVALCRYASGQGAATGETPMSFDAASGIWSLRTPGDLSGQYYTYLVDVIVPGVGLVRNRVTDPYSVSLTTDSTRSYIADLNAPRLKPPGWDATPRPQRIRHSTDMVVYELHVRDFSINDATVPTARRGKYSAFAESRSNGMKHLRALSEAGLTDIHLLPVFDIATIPEKGCVTPVVPKAAPDSEAQQTAVMAVHAIDCFNWGYDPFHFGAPEGSYASDAADGARRIIEFRQMVQALHRANLRVGMDVVYNHTSASGQHAQSVLDRIVPGYYQRRDAKGAVERSTCCDNTATEHRMMAKLMIDTAERWARDYKIDSFRFDLMAHQPRAAMEALQARVNAAAGQVVPLIGEGWNYGEVADGRRFVQASQLSLNGSHIGTFSDRGRDAARGGGASDSGTVLLNKKGWLNGAAEGPEAEAMKTADMIRLALAGSLRDVELLTGMGDIKRLAEIDYAGQPAGYASQPDEVVNYVDNHDNQTLFDINVLKLPPDTSHEDRARVQILGAALTAFSQGVAYFHAGIDTLRSKSMDRNSYDSGDWFNRLDWTYRDNGFAAGLPPRADNGALYATLAPLLAKPAIKPRPSDIDWTRRAFLDLLKIRASTPLLRLSTADAIKARLSFPGSGPTQNPALLAIRLDGQGMADAGFKAVMLLINVSPEAQTLGVPAEREPGGPSWRLHPVHRSATAADQRAAQARFAKGVFSVPGRTAVAFVLE